MTCPDRAARAAENDAARGEVARSVDPPAIPDDAVAALKLTRRERDVLRLIAEGQSTEEVAATLFLSANSVKTHTRTLFQKLGVTSRLKAAVWVWGRGWDAPA